MESDSDEKLPPGLYEALRTEALVRRLRRSEQDESLLRSGRLSPDDTAPALAAHLANLFTRAALSLREADRDAWADLIARLSSALADTPPPLRDLALELPLLPLEQLLEIARPGGVPGRAATPRPDSPLAVSALLTGSGRSPSLASQVGKELASADRADWLVSFIKWSGIRPLREALRRFTDTPDPAGGPRLRVATTSYLGATDLKAVQFLLDLPNTEVRVSYDTHRTRLHAKALLFHRATGFGSAYVGSANISRAAMDEGLEWTAKISRQELPHLWRQLIAAFESHWADDTEFEPLGAGDLPRLDRALHAERRQGSPGPQPPDTAFFDLRPYAFQQEILEQIAAERRAGIHRHLVIAATGTGKTMLAAFDYRGMARDNAGARPSLLFVAHREEILRQALSSFRQVLRNQEFGDLLVAGSQPAQEQHLFCSVQSWHSRGLRRLAPSHFDYVVLDEAHHASAESYRALLAHLRAKTLLGLTATPERMDGRDIRDDFGGRFTHEMRLPDAIERRLLAPFHYFGVGDHRSIDLSHLTWQRGGYQRADLNKVFGASEARAKWVLAQVHEYVTDAAAVRGLGFCVSQEHARFMADFFSARGMPSMALTADSPRQERADVQTRLVQRRLRFIFTVDLYNEGVDIPEVDTILLLRPTESLSVYLQQLGRGLRLHEDKAHLTVLDFIAPQHRQFRYADRFRALSANPAARLESQVQSGFPWLPSGCLISLDRVAAERVLENIRANLGMRRSQLMQSLGQCLRHHGGRPDFEHLLDWLHLDEPDGLLKHGLPSRLLAAAGGTGNAPEPGAGAYDSQLRDGLRRLATTTDLALLDVLARRLETAGPLDALAPDERMRLSLVHATLWGRERPGDGALEALDAAALSDVGLRRDLLDLARYLLARRVHTSGVRFPEHTGVLELHASYTREQVLLALGKGSLQSPAAHREGVLHLPERHVDLLFVTIRKSESEFSPTTMYEDYSLTDSLFHWQSQSGVSPASATGQRYIHHQQRGYQPMLFVRAAKRTDSGLAAPFTFCGPLRYVRHEGSRPMSILWRLAHPLPARVLRHSHRDAA